MLKSLSRRLLCLRAFKRVRAEEGECKIFEVINSLAQKSPSNPSFLLTVFLGRTVSEKLSSILTQKLLSETLDRSLAPAVMVSRGLLQGALVVPLPKNWRKLLKTQGVRLHFFSPLFFWIKMIGQFKSGFSYLRWLLRYQNQQAFFNQAYIAFISFPAIWFKSSSENRVLYNFLTYAKKRFPQSKFLVVGQSLSQETQNLIGGDFPFPALSGQLKIKFILSALGMYIKAIIAGASGRWELIYIYQDWLLYRYCQLVARERLPQKVIFSNSHYIYRPLWTYAAEQSGSEVILMFYATNTYNIKLNEGAYGLIPGYQGMTWPIYYTLHEQHRQFLKAVTCQEIEKIDVEPDLVLLEDIDEPLQLPTGYKIALFDIQPFRDAYLAEIGRPISLYTYEISTHYFKDLLEWCKNNQAYLIVKPKRETGRKLCQRYANMLKELSQHEHIRILPNGLSPLRVCKEVNAVITQPFTSAALFAKQCNIPVVYYDPTGLYQKQQPAAQEIEVLRDKEELFYWLHAMKRRVDA